MSELHKILVVEDSDLLQRMYDLVLRRYRASGAEVLHAYNGREGLDQLARHPDTDLVLLDINMPVMSGLEFLRRVKEQACLRHIPVVVVSTEGKEQDIMRGLKAGARGYIKKPFAPDDLHQLIDRIFVEAPGASEAVGPAPRS